MNYNPVALKEALIHNLQNTVDKSINPNITNLSELAEWFEKILLFKCGIKKIDGLTSSILPALQDLFIDRKSEVNSLKIIAEEIEPFLKKIVFIISEIDYSNSHYKSFAPLVKELGLSDVLSSKPPGLKYNQILNESLLVTYKNEDEFIEHICRSYIVRNDVHNSTNWDFIERYTNLNSLLIVYIYAIHKHLQIIKTKINREIYNVGNLLEEQKYDNHTKMIYDFISFGNSTNLVKNQIIESFILHHLLNNEDVSINNITEECNHHFQSKLAPSFFERLLQKLIRNEKIKIEETQYKLTVTEKKRLETVIENFTFKEQLLHIEFNEVLSRYGLESKIAEVYEEFKTIFQKYYNIDLLEILDKGTDITDNTIDCENLLKILESELIKNGFSGEEKLDIFEDLLIICEQNDFLHKISAANIYSTLTNNLHLQNYLLKIKREIYLDTQLLLYALCYWYEVIDKSDIPQYNIIRDLLKYCDTKGTIHLKTSTLYVREVSYHLKEAITLIPFEEIGLLESKYSSSNIFYQFYHFLKNENHLENHIDSYSTFIEEFDVNYSDVTNRNYFNEVNKLVEEYLLSIGIETINFGSQNRESAFESLKNSLRYSRPEITLMNDATCMTYLSNSTLHETEPFFTTWDHAFFGARKKYFTDNKGLGYWHLYYPSKLLNHLNLLEFKIEAKSLSNEFMSIINSMESSDNTGKLVDLLNNILDENQDNKRKYLKKIKEFKNRYVFKINEIDEPQEQMLQSQPITKLIKHLSYHYNNKANKYSFEDFKKVFNSLENFEKLMSSIEEELNYYIDKKSFSENIISEIDSLIEKSKNGSN